MILLLVLVRAFAVEAAFRCSSSSSGSGSCTQPLSPATRRPSFSSELYATPIQEEPFSSSIGALHTVNGIRCREVTNELPVIGTVRVLEATADSQEELVDECLHLEDDDDDDDDESALPPKRIARGDPYGAVMWPAAWAVSNYVLTDPGLRDSLPSTAVLELGTGTGLVSVSTALAGARKVLATDYEPLALDLTQYAAENLNNNNNSNNNGARPPASVLSTGLLDLCALHDPLPIPSLRGGDENAPVLVVAADVMYEPKTGAALAHRVVEALRQNCRVLVGDSPGRPGRPAFLQTLWELGVDRSVAFENAVGKTCTGPRHDLICGEGSTSVSPTPEELSVALIDLRPSVLLRKAD